MVKHFKMGDGATVLGAVTTDARFTPADHNVRGQEQPSPYLMVATVMGQVLRIPLRPFRNP